MNPSRQMCARALAVMRASAQTGRVDADDAKFLKAHLSVCESCSADQAIVRALAGESDLDYADAAMEKRIEAYFRAHASEDARDDLLFALEPPCRGVRSSAAIAAAAVVLLGISLLFGIKGGFFEHSDDEQLSTASLNTASGSNGPFSDAPKGSAQSSGSASRVSEDIFYLKTRHASKKVLLSGDITLLLKPFTTVRLPDFETSPVDIFLETGAVSAMAPPGSGETKFCVSTDLGKAKVKGTVLSVTANGRTDRVSVLRGKVLVTAEKGSGRTLTAGQSCSFKERLPRRLLPKEQKAMSRDANLMAGRDNGGVEIADLRAASAAAFRPAPAEQARGKNVGRDKSAGRPALGNIAKTLHTLLMQARQAKMRRDWSSAARIYRRIVKQYPDEEEAGAAMAAEADIQLHKLDNAGRALHLFNAYLASGKAALLQEATVGKASALKALGKIDEELVVLKKFVRRFPKSIHAAGVHRRILEIETLQKNRGAS